MDNTDYGQLWKYDDFAQFFRVSPQTVRKWVSNKTIPKDLVIKIGSQVRFDPNRVKVFFNLEGK